MEAAVPVVKRVIVALGFGFISYESVDTAFNGLSAAVTGTWAQVPSGPFQILSLAGFGTAIGIILGAMGARLAMRAMGSLGRIIQ